jgi:hypothetical protein
MLEVFSALIEGEPHAPLALVGRKAAISIRYFMLFWPER